MVMKRDQSSVQNHTVRSRYTTPPHDHARLCYRSVGLRMRHHFQTSPSWLTGLEGGLRVTCWNPEQVSIEVSVTSPEAAERENKQPVRNVGE